MTAFSQIKQSSSSSSAALLCSHTSARAWRFIWVRRNNKNSYWWRGLFFKEEIIQEKNTHTLFRVIAKVISGRWFCASRKHKKNLKLYVYESVCKHTNKRASQSSGSNLAIISFFFSHSPKSSWNRLLKVLSVRRFLIRYGSAELSELPMTSPPNFTLSSSAPCQSTADFKFRRTQRKL